MNVNLAYNLNHANRNLIDAETSGQAMKMAGLDWNVRSQMPKVELINGDMPLENYRVLVREDTESPLTIVGSKFRALQNVEVFEFMDRALNSIGARYHSAGAMKGGQIVWVQAEMPEAMMPVDGDAHTQYLLMVNFHGGGSVAVMPTTIRLWCQNQIAGLTNGSHIRHTDSMTAKLKFAENVVKGLPEYREKVNGMLSKWAKREVSWQEMQVLAKKAAGIKPEGDVEDRKEVAAPARKAYYTLLGLMKSGRGNAETLARGTALIAFNAASEFDTYYATSVGKDEEAKSESRVHRIWFRTRETRQAAMVKALEELDVAA